MDQEELDFKQALDLLRNWEQTDRSRLTVTNNTLRMLLNRSGLTVTNNTLRMLLRRIEYPMPSTDGIKAVSATGKPVGMPGDVANDAPRPPEGPVDVPHNDARRVIEHLTSGRITHRPTKDAIRKALDTADKPPVGKTPDGAHRPPESKAFR